jgi:hypothetical protein
MSTNDRRTAARVYLAVAILGLALVLIPLIGWLRAHGLDMELALAELSATRMTAAAVLDLIGAAVAVLAMIYFDRKELRVPYIWIPVVFACTVSVAFGLAFYLFLRESVRPEPAAAASPTG